MADIWIINTITSLIKQVISPILGLFKARSENIALVAKIDELNAEIQIRDEKIRKLDNRNKELEAPEHAQKLSYPLCLCTTQPQIMHQISPDKFKCEKCGTEKSTNSSATFSEPKWHS